MPTSALSMEMTWCELVFVWADSWEPTLHPIFISFFTFMINFIELLLHLCVGRLKKSYNTSYPLANKQELGGTVVRV